MMVTADTITNGQIWQLQKELLRESENQMTYDTDACGTALRDPESFPEHVRDTARVVCRLMRERCAEIWNARHGGA